MAEKLKSSFGFISKFLLHDLDLKEPEPEVKELVKAGREDPNIL